MSDERVSVPLVHRASDAASRALGRGDDSDLSDMLQEMRVLLQGAQVLSAFLIVIPFNTGFAKINSSERWVYVATFASAMLSLILLSAPAAQHRLERPLADRDRFKQSATRAILWGVAALSCALVLATQLVVSEVLGRAPGMIIASLTALAIAVSWWILPVLRKHRHERLMGTHPLTDREVHGSGRGDTPSSSGNDLDDRHDRVE